MSFWFWIMVGPAFYFAVSSVIYIADGYFNFSYDPKDTKKQNHDSLMGYTFLWPIFLVFLPAFIPMFLRDKLVLLRKKRAAKEAEVKKLRIAQEKELETYKAEVDDYLVETSRKRNSYE